MDKLIIIRYHYRKEAMMTLGKYGPFQVSMRTCDVARLVVGKHYDDYVAGTSGRKWDCSYFIWKIFQMIQGVDKFLDDTILEILTTLHLHQVATAYRQITKTGVGIIFLYDSESTDQPNKCIHAGLVVNCPGVNPAKEGLDGGDLTNVLVLDMFETTGHTHQSWSIHPVSDWFAITPITDVKVTKFAGVSTPVFTNSARFVLAGAFISFKDLLRLATLWA